MIILSMIAGISELLGMWIVGNKNRYAFILFVLGGLCWIVVGIHKQLPGLLVVCIPGLFINTRNFIKWKPKDLIYNKNMEEVKDLEEVAREI